jgi:N-acylneuraminate cytidylyltransferase
MKEWHYNFGPNAYRLEIDKRSSVDIDDVYDLECAKAWLNTLPPQ